MAEAWRVGNAVEWEEVTGSLWTLSKGNHIDLLVHTSVALSLF